MRYETAREAIAAGESQSVEFKQRLSSDRQLAKALSALANSGGGWLVVGVSDSGVLVGLADAEVDVTSDRMLSTAEFSIEPPVSVAIESVNAYGKTAIAARIPDSPDKPHFILVDGVRDGVFVRSNAASVPAGVDMVKALRSRWTGATHPIALGKIERIWV
ncbi:MAG: ATP-binding protein, partial [Cyanobacteria bacterium J06648_11]